MAARAGAQILDGTGGESHPGCTIQGEPMTQRRKSRTVIIAGATLLGAALVPQHAAADIGPAPDFAVSSFGGVPTAEGDTVTISIEGCEKGTSTAVGNWSTQATLEGPIGSPNSIISGGISTATDPNPDGTWTFSLVFEDEGLGVKHAPTPGTYQIRLRCSRWNGDNPPAVELIDITYEFDWGVVTTTTQPPRTSTTSPPAPTDDTQGTTAPAPTDPPVVDSGAGDELPVTGSSTLPLLALGAGLFVAGVAASAARGRLSAR